MTQRSSTVVAGLNADADAKAESERLANMAMIPAPTYEASIPIESVYVDRTFNVRADSSYDVKDNLVLYESLKTNGLMRIGTPMSFSLQPDGRLKTLAGNLRLTLLLDIREKEINRRKDANEPADPSTLPGAIVFGNVYRGLTFSQETQIMSDHMGVKQLTPYEQCKAFGEFAHRTAYTDKQMSVLFGVGQNSIQRARWRYEMPTVLEEYRKEFSKNPNEGFIKIGQKELTVLHTAIVQDQKMGCEFRVEGPNFKAAWQTMLAQGIEPTPPKVDSRPRKDVLQMASGLPATFGNGPEIGPIADILRWAGNESVNLADAISNITLLFKSAREDVAVLTADNDKLVGEIKSLTSVNADLLKRLETSQTDNATLQTEVNSLKASLDAVRTAKNSPVPAKTAK